MQDSAKYLIHANITADGVVERSDVVGAIFGQTEGLLGNELDLRELQQSSKVGRIDVEIRSENGQSFGSVTIASGLDRVETAILAASLETIDRVGPCRSTFEVERIEDVRAAKRREVVDRAKELISSFEGDVMTSQELVEEVRRAIRVEDITEYEGLPAGPRVDDSDAIVVVEGRADVLQLLQYGIKNAVAVEGTNVPESVARLTQGRTVTAFLDGDRGGDLILKELTQVGDVDYVAFAPEGRSVEDLSRDEVMAALRDKVPYELVADASSPHEVVASTDGSARPAPPGTTDAPDEGAETTESAPDAADAEATDGESAPASPASGTDGDPSTAADESAPSEATDSQAVAEDGERADEPDSTAVAADGQPETLAGHVHAVVGERTGTVRLLDSDFGIIESAPVESVFETVAGADRVPATVVVDDELSQRVLDVAAQRGVEQIVARTEGQFVKRPTSVRVRTADQFDLDVEAAA